MSNIDYGQANPVFPAPEYVTPVADLENTDFDAETETDLDDAQDTAAVSDAGSPDVEYPADDVAEEADADDQYADNTAGRAASGVKSRNIGTDRQFARRTAAKALALNAVSAETRDLLKTLLGSSSDDAVSLTVDIMVGSAADARRVGNSLVALRNEFDEDPVAAGFAVMELDRDSLEQVWKLVHALGQDIPPRPPAATGKAVRPLAKAVSQINASTVTLLTDALALTNRS
jgi:hypothetical protein